MPQGARLDKTYHVVWYALGRLAHPRRSEETMNIWFALAAGTSAATCALHLVLGGRVVARPLLDVRGLGVVPKFTAYYCWHLVTIAIAVVAIAFALAAAFPAAAPFGLAAAMVSAAFSLWSLAMVALYRLPLRLFPQWLLFLPAAGAGLAGALS